MECVWIYDTRLYEEEGVERYLGEGGKISQRGRGVEDERGGLGTGENGSSIIKFVFFSGFCKLLS